MKRGIFYILICFLGACNKGTTTSSSPSKSVAPPEFANDFNICSKLNFTDVGFDAALKLSEQRAFMLALNISGSYEGNSAWSNLANNFDGQGMSLGLLNQNLGQGTLQPLMIRMRDHYFDKMKTIFSKNHLTSLLAMLSEWEGLGLSTMRSEEEVISTFDIFPFLTPQNEKSVEWAESTIYNGDKIKADWAQEFTAMAESPEYITIQVSAAQSLHKKAVGYVAKLNVPEIRAYLLAFDFVTQNGGLHAQDLQDYASFLSSNPQAPNSEKLSKILELRLRNVLPQFVADVRSRKSTIISGNGTVHGAKRNLEKEYCFDRFFAILMDPNRLFQFFDVAYAF